MSKKTALLIALSMFLSLISCGANNKKCEEHTYQKEGFMGLVCENCQDRKTNAPKSVKILAIGNSFSDDSTYYLWNILNDAGVENITIGNLFLRSCSLDMHYENATNDLSKYEYRETTNGQWNSTPQFTIKKALEKWDWDIVTFQQASADSGLPESYKNLSNLLEYVEARVPQECQFYWHMTWAYQKDSSHKGFSSYKNNQNTMYQAICKTAKEQVMADARFAGILPAGTAVQNLRTSYIGDTLTLDGHHLSRPLGRYLAAMSWFAGLGGNVREIRWCPDKTVKEHLPAIYDALESAVQSPFSQTKSNYTKKK